MRGTPLGLCPPKAPTTLPFFSLLPYFGRDALLEEEGSLRITVDMYWKLISLFVSGETQPMTGVDGSRQDQASAGSVGAYQAVPPPIPLSSALCFHRKSPWA